MLRSAGQGLEFAGWIVIARGLGSDGFGRLSVAFVACRYGALVADWGASFRGPRDIAADRPPEEVAALVRRRAASGVALSAIAVVALVLTGNTALAAIAVVALAGGVSRDWIALGREAGVRSAAPFLLRGLLLVGGALVVSTEGTAAACVGAAYGAAALVSIVLNPVPRAAGARGGVDAWMLVATVMAQIYTSLDTLLLAALDSTRAAGIYAAVYRLPLAWVTVSGLLVSGLTPVATRAVRTDPARVPELRRRLARAGAIAGVLLLVAAPLLVWAVPVLFGDAYISGRVPLALLLVATALATVTAPLGALYLGLGRDRDFALVLTAGAVLNVVGNVVAIPLWGMRGAAATTILSEGLVLALMWRALRRAETRKA